jgi:NADH-quinone oxidoreductase subunit K
MTLLTSAFLLFFSLSSYCFWIGIFGLCTVHNRNLILILLSIELQLLGLCGYFLLFTYYHVLVIGQLYTLVLITIAGAESALGLALMMIVYRLTTSLDIQTLQALKY